MSTTIISADPAATALEKQRRGLLQISITNYDTTSESYIEKGSIIEVGGALYEVSADESMSNSLSSFSDGTVYITTDVVDSSTIQFIYTDTAPTWDNEKQGWYDATGTDRYLIEGTKNGTEYNQKKIYDRNINNFLQGSGLYLNNKRVVPVYDKVSSLITNKTVLGDSFIRGMTNDGTNLYYGRRTDDNIYKYDFNTDTHSLFFSTSFGLKDMTTDGTNLILKDNIAGTPKVYVMDGFSSTINNIIEFTSSIDGIAVVNGDLVCRQYPDATSITIMDGISNTTKKTLSNPFPGYVLPQALFTNQKYLYIAPYGVYDAQTFEKIEGISIPAYLSYLEGDIPDFNTTYLNKKKYAIDSDYIYEINPTLHIQG